MANQKHTNQLIHESSPYLLQHAHNPVDWHPWNDITLEKARQQDKMILVSIGYSACHWCHVMEHESFEDEEVAKIMNEHFICIKVDREERPDVDHVYMDAVQMISGRGGWPLNCFALPDGKPFWGGTYFNREQWIGILENIILLYKTQKNKIEQQASDLYSGISENSFIDPGASNDSPFDQKTAEEMAVTLGNRFDMVNGGSKGAPKFPMPNNLLFLLRYHYFSGSPEALDQVLLTLKKMACGGIYDQVGGGFARYSVDAYWHIPHFEKMLYDNAQLVSLYAEAYMVSKEPVFKKVIDETLEFVKRELTMPQGGFYSALDADSDGVEGKFYVWNDKEFKVVLGEDAGIMSRYFGVGDDAYWEKGYNVLVVSGEEEKIKKDFNIDDKTLTDIIKRSKAKLLEARSSRIRPGLDDKMLTSWNALMIQGLIDAYKALGNREYLDRALKSIRFLTANVLREDGSLKRTWKDEKATIDGFLDDYSFFVQALIELYQVTFDKKWILLAKKVADYVMDHFYDETSGMFFYTSDRHKDNIVRKTEVTDNVIPASNSSMAMNLYVLGLLFEDFTYPGKIKRMINNIKGKMVQYPSAFSNWGILYLNLTFPEYTMVVTGPDAHSFASQLRKEYRPDIYYAGGEEDPGIPITQNRFSKEKTRVYVCTGSECSLPAEKIDEVLPLIKTK